MIEVLYPNGTKATLDAVSFEELQALVGGYVECNHVRENGQIVQAICNEDGLSQGLPDNLQATTRFRGKLMMGPNAVGTWVVLSGKDMLQ